MVMKTKYFSYGELGLAVAYRNALLREGRGVRDVSLEDDGRRFILRWYDYRRYMRRD